MSSKYPTFPARLFLPGPKRLLALDGGGVRGVLSLGLLKRMESVLREEHGDPQLTLSDYFDLIGGTSTGAIIATLLSLGRTVSEIEELYSRFAEEVFRPKKSLFGRYGKVFRAEFDEKPLAQLLEKELGDRTLGSDEYQSGLMIVAKRADTASVWPLVNIPTQKYFEFNKHLTLWEILRASTAAPTYFRPQMLSDVGQGEQGVFVDGAVSMHNSPALLLLMVASLKGFGLNWPVAEDKILLCSIGTGSVPRLSTVKLLDIDRNLSLLPVVMSQLLSDASELNSTILQWMSRSPTAQAIDSQIGDLSDDLVSGNPLLTFLRYDFSLTKENLTKVDYNIPETDFDKLHDISCVHMIPHYKAIGELAAAQIQPGHFASGFNVAKVADS